MHAEARRGRFSEKCYRRPGELRGGESPRSHRAGGSWCGVAVVASGRCFAENSHGTAAAILWGMHGSGRVDGRRLIPQPADGWGFRVAARNDESERLARYEEVVARSGAVETFTLAEVKDALSRCWAEDGVSVTPMGG